MPGIVSRYNIFQDSRFEKCIVDLDRQAFKDVTFTNSVVRYHGGAVSLSNVTFVNCRFVLDLFSAPASQPQQLLLLALLQSPDLRTVNVSTDS